MLALSVGFNAALSGRETASSVDLPPASIAIRVDERYEEIADFAELGDFMDLRMQTYSSGVYSRLAFAVAVHIEPDILLVDEALSAGDAKFKQKAQRRMLDLCDQARTILLVAHALQTVKDMWTESIWMHNGQLIQRGKPDGIVEAYTKFLRLGEDASRITLENV